MLPGVVLCCVRSLDTGASALARLCWASFALTLLVLAAVQADRKWRLERSGDPL